MRHLYEPGSQRELQDLIFTTQKIRPWNQPFQKGRFVEKKGQMSTILPPVADGLGKDK